jgi:Lon-like protease
VVGTVALVEGSEVLRRRWWDANVSASSLVALAVLVLAVVVVWGRGPSGYGLTKPGPVVRLSGEVSGSLATDPGPDPSGGWLAFTTVEVAPASWFDLASGVLAGRSVVRLANPEFTDGLEMFGSRRNASAAAVSFLGHDPQAMAGVLVLEVFPGTPAQRAGLKAGDLVVSFTGLTTVDGDDLVAVLRPNDPVAMLVMRGGQLAAVEVTPDADGRIGVRIGTVNAGAGPAFEVDTGTVSGSSAGLMLTLSFIDAASPGDLTGGLRVAGTGTVAPDGTVGAVAGGDLKVEAAVDVGAEVFLAPRNLAAKLAPFAADNLEVIPVDSVEEAVSALCARGATDEVCRR